VPGRVIALLYPPFPRFSGTWSRTWPHQLTIVDGVIFFFRSGVGLWGYGQKADALTLDPKGFNAGARGLRGSLFLCGRIENGYRSNRLAMKSPVIKHSIVVAGRRTAVSLEDAFWEGLREIAKERNETLKGLVTRINADRQMFNLSSAIRVFVLDYYRNCRGPGSA